jgi:HlyD family secretion protein
VHHARIGLDTANLRVERTTVRAPSSGRVLALVARPGMRLMGLSQGTLQDSSTVVTVYDPAQLQVRADVRYEDLPRVQPGQRVRIESPAAPGDALEGEVLFPTSLADIQKNTLQVKVAIKSPPAVLKPDMLVQVTFLAPEMSQAKRVGSEQLRLMMPRQLIESQDGSPRVWVADRVGRVASRRAIKIGQGMRGDLVEVSEGLNAGDQLISGGREGLSDGQRIHISGEDATLGAEMQLQHQKPAHMPRLTGGDAKSTNP